MIQKSLYGLLSTLVLLFSCTNSNLPDKQNAPESRIRSNLYYGSHPDQVMDIYIPMDSNKNGIALLYVHGGSWFGGDKTEAVHWAEWFQQKGYTVACINYRKTNTVEKNIHPAQMHDISKAIQYLQSNADKYFINKDHLVIMGASAGGHLALLYAYAFDKLQNINGAIALCPITDLTDDKLLTTDFGGMTGGTVVSLLLGDTLTKRPELWKNANPVNHLSKDVPPTFLVHGNQDDIVSYEQSLNVYKALKRYSVPAQLRLLDDVGHNLLDIDISKTFEEVHRFILQHVN